MNINISNACVVGRAARAGGARRGGARGPGNAPRRLREFYARDAGVHDQRCTAEISERRREFTWTIRVSVASPRRGRRPPEYRISVAAAAARARAAGAGRRAFCT
ncbi:hypothetical protein EVAR_51849_1 [Eumeta japonica]|uniref:Uncharacterized protein n=1 Tax=Eumeta variegata TaxID=151549 RepID=A0A4C1YU31_EUMVA|nr:hypothetical protein EVAR_51849_1 [Eumeta japonica]